MAANLNEETFQDFLAEHGAVLVDFYKDGCVPCRRVAPLVSQAEALYEGRAAIARVNVTSNVELANQLSIESTPTLIVFRDGTEVSRHRGVIKKDELKQLVETAL